MTTVQITLAVFIVLFAIALGVIYGLKIAINDKKAEIIEWQQTAEFYKKRAWQVLHENNSNSKSSE
jgi:hypothetical protein